jgi:hypothetical protein
MRRRPDPLLLEFTGLSVLMAIGVIYQFVSRAAALFDW